MSSEFKTYFISFYYSSGMGHYVLEYNKEIKSIDEIREIARIIKDTQKLGSDVIIVNWKVL